MHLVSFKLLHYFWETWYLDSACLFIHWTLLESLCSDKQIFLQNAYIQNFILHLKMKTMKCNILDIFSKSRKEGQSKRKNTKGQPEQNLSLTEIENEKEEIFLWFFLFLPLFTLKLRIACLFIMKFLVK